MDANENRSYLPSCWSDDIRMRAMFTVFRAKELNPEGWQEKMNFWINCIFEFCRKSRKVSVTASEIVMAFERDRSHPKCIREVLDYMYSEGMITLDKDFQNVDYANTWLGWGYRVLKKPVILSYFAVKGMLFEAKNEEVIEERYVLIDVAKNVASQVFSRQKELEKYGDFENVVELNDFASRVTDICERNDLELVLAELKREKKVVSAYESGEQYFKFKNDDLDSVEPLTSVDKAIVRLKKASDAVSLEIDLLEREIGKCIIEAKHFMKSGSKMKAMMVLKKKKRMEMALKKKISAADNLETLLLQLKSCGSEKLVIGAYSAGVDVMKTNELDLDKIDTVMADLGDLVNDVSEIGATLSKSFTDEDLSDYENELDKLLAEEEEELYEIAVRKREKSADESHEDLLRRLEALRVPSSNISPERVRTAHFAT